MSISYKQIESKKILSADKLTKALQALREDLGEGLIASEIWVTLENKIVAFDHDRNKQPEAIALLSEVTRKLDKTLKGADYPGLGNYYFINLSNNNMIVVLTIGTYQQYILVNLSKTSMGILMSVALPNLLSALAEAEDLTEAATESPAETGLNPGTRKPSAVQAFIDKFTKGMYYLL